MARKIRTSDRRAEDVDPEADEPVEGPLVLRHRYVLPYRLRHRPPPTHTHGSPRPRLAAF